MSSQKTQKIAYIGYGDIATRVAHLFANTSKVQVGLCRRPEVKEAPIGLELHAGNAQFANDLARVVDAHTDVVVLTLTPDSNADDPYHAGYVVPCRLLQHHLQSKGLNPLVIYVSSTGVYHQCNGEVVNESTRCEPDNHRGQMLLQAEQTVRSATEHCVVLRCAGIYGPGRERLAKLIKKGQVTITPAITNYIHADDVAGFIHYLVNHPEHHQPTFIVSDDQPLPQAEAYARVAACVEVDSASLNRSDEIGPRGSKRLSNRLLRTTGYQLKYPTYKPC